MCAARRVTTWPTRRIRLGALEVLTRPRVDLDLVTALDEERHVHANSRLERRGLRRAGRRIALETEIGGGDREDDRRRHLDADRRALVLAQDHGHAVGQVVRRVAELIIVERDLVIRRRVHEVVMRAVLVHELHVPVIEARPLVAIVRLERLLDEIAFSDVAQLHAHLRAAASELDVLELDDLVQHAVELDGHSALDLPGAYHVFFVSSMSQRRASSYPATPFPMNCDSVTSFSVVRPYISGSRVPSKFRFGPFMKRSFTPLARRSEPPREGRPRSRPSPR